MENNMELLRTYLLAKLREGPSIARENTHDGMKKLKYYLTIVLEKKFVINDF